MKPERWQTQTEGPEAQAGRLAAEVGEPVMLSAAAQARIAARLAAPASPWSFSPRLVWLGVAVAAAAVAGGALVSTRFDTQPPAPDAPRTPVKPEPEAAPPKRPPVSTASPERVPFAPMVAPANAPSPVTARVPSAAAVRSVRPAGPADGGVPADLAVSPEVAQGAAPHAAAPTPNELLEESRLLGRAITQLRHDAAPRLALTTLDEYFARYPAGALAGDAEIVRIDALLSLDRTAEAVAHLDALSAGHFRGLARAAELLVLHGELLLQARQPQRAEQAFTEALEREPPDALAERALYGRAVALGLAGDAVRSHAELERYLARFPAGRFATAAREAL